MTSNEIRKVILDEATVASNYGASIQELYDYCGSEVLPILRQMRSEGLIRLVAIGDAVGGGWDLSKCVQGEGEVYGVVELPQ